MHRGLPCSNEKLEFATLHEVVPQDPLPRGGSDGGGRPILRGGGVGNYYVWKFAADLSVQVRRTQDAEAGGGSMICGYRCRRHGVIDVHGHEELGKCRSSAWGERIGEARSQHATHGRGRF
jgi:hypothetical protein